ncbi:hypothetical protein BN7_3224 [Wickerhamomyces ciferrii]|uniref:protein-histidine N-methyltransferase n=1 Tax=Wickerhamomyces ciferrii (strain ATCC 14091 / BCRC 22168 / CBS 111 / JCM 3599 / NBRC 0793 / NRRL Y-1031 F-60-10) TaxID=1206466 RepID=K0KKY4_WICCF|nr:uncharacterized protein BN7_3224 [Wickerhamomyces ciferrii]CCH43671.1 hypothetical protein BN7_3224 [Wickerhamomyces ciferrii]
MSFSFGFSAESDDEFIESGNTAQINHNELKLDQNPLDVENSEAKAPKIEDFNQVLESLVDVRITFEKVITPQGQTVFRRELFDVKHQLMNEEGSEKQDEEFGILMGTDTSDLQRNIYEGGLKSWECSIDTVDKLSALEDQVLFNGEIVELGCGTALPSTYLFQRALSSNLSNINFKLSDYNHSVLRLVTLPNLIIAWCSTLSSEKLSKLQKSGDEEIPIVDDELQLTQQLLKEFSETLKRDNIKIELYSGAWNRSFFNLITHSQTSSKIGLIITSETIYSPETLPIISELIIELVFHSKTQQNGSPLALVAAKDIYFGVGGSLVDFENYLTTRIQQGSKFQFQTDKVKAGLQRSIVSIR